MSGWCAGAEPQEPQLEKASFCVGEQDSLEQSGCQETHGLGKERVREKYPLVPEGPLGHHSSEQQLLGNSLLRLKSAPGVESWCVKCLGLGSVLGSGNVE